MAEAIVGGLVKSIGLKVGSEIWKKIVGAADIESQIKELQDYKNSIEATLLDAESSQICSHSQRLLLEKLESGLAKLIDFEDAKAAKEKQKELMSGTSFTKEVRLFFSASNQLVSPFRDAGKIKRITGELSRTARNYAQYGGIVSSSPLNQTLLSNASGSGSYMSTDIVFGRDRDRDEMVNSLLDSSGGVLPVASIVGIGGIGKTTLAQYVYHDERIKQHFDLQLWVSATQDFDVKDVLRQMVSDEKGALHHDIDHLQRRVYQAIVGRRFLLVLDDVWDDDGLKAKWIQLRSLLRVGAQGSRVLLTTRNQTVSSTIGTQEPLIVRDLGSNDSLLLLRYMAASQSHEPRMEAIAEEIANMCPRVPIVIRAIGSLLAAKQTVREWAAFRDAQLANFASYGKDVIGTLKLSYDQLGTRQKLCLVYCSLFPKRFQFQKSTLIRLWIAMGYVEDRYGNQSLEEVAEGYVLCLLNRGFFYYVGERNGFKCPDFFQMHNLMHDLVLSIAGFKYKMADSNTNEFDERVCHVSYHLARDESPFKVPSSLFKIKRLKSFLLPLPSGEFNQVRLFPLNDISIFTIESLRVLRMHGLGIKKVPRSISKMIHLRYLDFSHNPIRKLPESITQLVNMYLLDLSYCESLEELPREISKLVALTHLILDGCTELSHMPKGLSKLTRLETLCLFIVGKSSNSLTLYGPKAKLACDLADLGYLDNLKGELTIILVDRSEDIVSEAKAANLDRKEITKLTMVFSETRLEDEMVLENLKPHVDLEFLVIGNYGGKRLPSWMSEGIHLWLPNLVEIHITECKECIHMCSFGRLPHLESLKLSRLHKVEYIENDSSNAVAPLFPSLRFLCVCDMRELKGWWCMRDSHQDRTENQLVEWMPPFPRLTSVDMDMRSVISLAEGFLRCIPYLESLNILGGASNVGAGQRQEVIPLKNYLPMIREIELDCDEIEHLPEEFRGIPCLEVLVIFDCEALEEVPEWIDSLTSLKTLHILKCPRLKSLPQEISNLSSLNTLSLHGCSRELAERCESPSGEDWPKIQRIPNITIKPAGQTGENKEKVSIRLSDDSWLFTEY